MLTEWDLSVSASAYGCEKETKNAVCLLLLIYLYPSYLCLGRRREYSYGYEDLEGFFPFGELEMEKECLSLNCRRD